MLIFSASEVSFVYRRVTSSIIHRHSPKEYAGSRDKQIISKVRFILFRCSRKVVFADGRKFVYAFCQIGNFLCGYVSDEQLFLDVANMEEPVEDTERSSDIQRRDFAVRNLVNNILLRAPEGNITFREVEEFILGNFGEQTVAVFRYGQKQALSDVAEALGNLARTALVDVAIGMEVEKPGYLLSYGTGMQRAFQDCYSFLGHKNVCNLFIGDQTYCRRILPGASRIVGYNTAHHTTRRIKKDFALKLKIVATEESQSLDIVLKESIARVIDIVTTQVVPAFENSKLRLEAYYQIGPTIPATVVKDLLKHYLSSKCQVMEVPVGRVRELLLGYCTVLKSMWGSRSVDTYSSVFSILTLYDRFMSGLYNTQRITKTFMECSRGVALDMEIYKNSELELKADYLLKPMCTTRHLIRYIYKSKYLDYLETIIELLRHCELCEVCPFSTLTHEMTGQMIDRLVGIITGLSQQAGEVNVNAELEELDFKDYLKKLRSHFSSKIIIRMLLDKLLSLEQSPSGALESLQARIANQNYTTRINGKNFGYLGTSGGQNVNTLRQCVTKHTFSEFVRLMENLLQGRPLGYAGTYIKAIYCSWLNAEEEVKKLFLNRGTDLVLDADAVSRLVFAMVPDFGGDLVFLWIHFQSYTSFESLLKFTAGIARKIWLKNDQVIPKNVFAALVKKARKPAESLAYRGKRINRPTLTASQLLLFTGIFSSRCNLTVNLKELPSRIDFEELVDVSTRARLYEKNEEYAKIHNQFVDNSTAVVSVLEIVRKLQEEVGAQARDDRRNEGQMYQQGLQGTVVEEQQSREALCGVEKEQPRQKREEQRNRQLMGMINEEEQSSYQQVRKNNEEEQLRRQREKQLRSQQVVTVNEEQPLTSQLAFRGREDELHRSQQALSRSEETAPQVFIENEEDQNNQQVFWDNDEEQQRSQKPTSENDEEQLMIQREDQLKSQQVFKKRRQSHRQVIMVSDKELISSQHMFRAREEERQRSRQVLWDSEEEQQRSPQVFQGSEEEQNVSSGSENEQQSDSESHQKEPNQASDDEIEYCAQPGSPKRRLVKEALHHAKIMSSQLYEAKIRTADEY